MVAKPFTRAQLLEAVAGAVERRNEVARVVEEDPSKSPPLRVLLAEDNPDNVLLMRVHFEALPHRLDVVSDGREAVEHFKRGGYDLVLMDLQMPVMDGFAATRAIRHWERARGWGRTRVVALTAHGLDEERRRGEAAGCDDHLVKPITKGRLLELLGG